MHASCLRHQSWSDILALDLQLQCSTISTLATFSGSARQHRGPGEQPDLRELSAMRGSSTTDR